MGDQVATTRTKGFAFLHPRPLWPNTRANILAKPGVMVEDRYAVIGNPLRPVMAKPVSCGIPWASLGRQTACMRRFTTPSPTPSTAISDSAWKAPMPMNTQPGWCASISMPNIRGAPESPMSRPE